MEARAMGKNREHFPVAIVGMHGRFPGAYDVRDFWQNLSEGNNIFGLVPKQRWDWQKTFGSSAEANEKTTINCAAFMPMVDRFDHRFFGIMPREAEAMDPQQRLFLQTAYAALEDAGYAPSSISETNTGVFVGIGNADYPGMMRREGAIFDIYRATGLALTCIANRTSFSLNAHGPSESIDTACSGSLVAIHRAIQSMQYGECDKAIVGGVNLLAGPDLFIAFDKAGMLSKTARCKTFDADANGYVRGEGVAALVLTPLKEAEKNGDYIYAVIQGSAENHGGRAHSFTAPNAKAQAEVIKTAWKNSGKNYLEASIIETHGTGTPLGDPIEINGLKKVNESFSYERNTSKNPSIALGALKSHVGHMEAAAGVGGVIKTILSMKNRLIPKNLNFSTLSPHIDLSTTPYYIPTKNTTITKPKSNGLLAGISSFGFGGVNAHVVIEDYNNTHSRRGRKPTKRPYLIPLSGKDKNGLYGRVQQLINFLEDSLNLESEDAHYLIVLDALCVTLTNKTGQDLSKDIMLSDINQSPLQLMDALRKLTPLLGRTVEFNEVANCVTLQECAQKITRNTEVHKIIHCAHKLALGSRVALPRKEVCEVELAQISYSLMHGRDCYKERLVCIAQSKSDLLNRLKAFIQAPDNSHKLLWTHTIKTTDSLTDKPATPLQSNSIAAITAWAHWWVGTKSAALNWSSVYPKVKTPRKVPLPAYPFQLDHIWYKSLSVNSDSDKHIPTIQPFPQVNVDEPLSVSLVNLTIGTAWKEILKESRIMAPSSMTSLAYMIDYAYYKNENKALTLKDIIFGRPSEIQDENLVFSTALNIKEGGKLIQCLNAIEHKKVLSEAQLVQVGGANLAKLDKDFIKQFTTLLPKDYFEEELQRSALLLSPAWSFIQSIQSGHQALKIGIKLPIWQAKSTQFWAPLLASMLSGLVYLSQQKNTAIKIIWKADSITFNPESSDQTNTLILRARPDRNVFDLLLNNSQSEPVLTMTGITLRQSANVIPIKKHAKKTALVVEQLEVSM